ncbi:MAG: c-type cytochrome [Chitinophagaceae bacterium]|nr:c-type cytochrome [Chitinophagaceae bacterium]
MICFRSVKNKMALMVIPVFAASVLTAQTTAPAAAQPVTSGYNQLAVLLMIMIIVLAFVIWGMGQVLTALGKQLIHKNKAAASSIKSIVLLAAISLLSQVSFAQGTAPAAAAQQLPNYGGLSATAYYMLLTVITMELVVILFLAFSIRRMYTELLPEKIKPKPQGSKLADWWSKLDKKLFTKAVAVEKEADILLDHDYDGIRELDNALPPWWKYGFYITIGVAFVYLLNFHVLGTGLNPTEEYNAEMEKARIAIEKYEAGNKDRIDEKNVPMADAAGIEAGRRLFEANCIACHLKDGGGSVGPNLTDNYWIHKGSINDIYNTIKIGYPDKGMQSWSGQFTPKEISFLASYIKTLVGTKPAVGKEQQGEFYVDGPVTDSASVKKTDSLPVKMPDSALVVKPDPAGVNK